MPCHHAGCDRHDIHILSKRESKTKTKQKQKAKKQIKEKKKKKQKEERKIEDTEYYYGGP